MAFGRKNLRSLQFVCFVSLYSNPGQKLSLGHENFAFHYSSGKKQGVERKNLLFSQRSNKYPSCLIATRTAFARKNFSLCYPIRVKKHTLSNKRERYLQNIKTPRFFREREGLRIEQGMRRCKRKKSRPKSALFSLRLKYHYFTSRIVMDFWKHTVTIFSGEIGSQRKARYALDTATIQPIL